MGSPRDLYCSSVTELTQLALSQLPNSVELVNERPLANYIAGLRKLLRGAAASRQEEDWERMYMYLVQYLVTIVKIIPQHNDCDCEDVQDDLDGHRAKVDLVKQELENLKSRLAELYEDECADTGGREGDSENEDTETTHQLHDRAEDHVASTDIDSDDHDVRSLVYHKSPRQSQRLVHDEQSTLDNADQQHAAVAATAVMPAEPLQTPPDIPQLLEPDGPDRDEVEEKRMMEQKPQERLSERMTKREIKRIAQLQRKESIMSKRRSIESRLEEMMDAMRTGERPHIYNAKDDIVVRPLPGTVFKEDETTIRARQEIQWRNRIREQRQRFIEHSLSMDMDAMPRRQPFYEQTLATHSSDTVRQSAGDSSTSVLLTASSAAQQRVGTGVASLAQNEALQQRIALGVESAAKSERVRSAVGEAIAQSSDSALVQRVARSSTAQKAVGDALANTVGNREVQRKVGHAVAAAAADREVQERVASGLLSVGAMALKGGAAVARVGAKATVATAKAGYDIYREQQAHPG